MNPRESVRKQLKFDIGFKVIAGDRVSQAATMTILAGHPEGGPNNRHAKSDQWLYVVSGLGKATVGGRSKPLRSGTLLFIPRGTSHEIRNTDIVPLRTLNVYVPPAYDKSGDPLPRSK